tara:strand:+ start:1586 stop:1810 length:225 start_codon:yes stop_codon:yes gene_type:complete
MKDSYLEEHIPQIFECQTAEEAFTLLQDITKNSSIGKKDAKKILVESIRFKEDLPRLQMYASNLRLKFMGLGTR